MKVLEFITRLNIGGPSFHVLSIMEGLKQRGWETILVTGRAEEYEGDLLKEIENYDITVKVIPELKSGINPLRDLIAFFKFLFILKKEKPHVLHSHTAKAGFMGRTGGFLFKILFRKKIMIVHTFHGFIFEGYFSKFTSRLILAIERLLAMISDKIICVSDSLKKLALERYHLAPESKLAVIHYGLNPDSTDPPVLSEGDPHQFTFGIVVRLVPIKGHELFLESAKALLKDTEENMHIQFAIIGDGPERERIKLMANKLGIEKNVLFSGWKRSSIYDNIDVLCVTSRNEGVPFVILEALLSGIPAIAVDSGGIRDIFTVVKDNGAFYICKEGILVKERKSESMVEAMQFLLHNRQLCREMGAEGHNRIKKDFSMEKMLFLLNELFTEKQGVQ